MTYVLVVLSTLTSPIIAFQEFGSKEACEVARAWVMQRNSYFAADCKPTGFRQ